MAKDNFYSRKTSLQAMVNAPSASVCSAHRPANCLPSNREPRPYLLPLLSGRQLSLTCLTVWEPRMFGGSVNETEFAFILLYCFYVYLIFRRAREPRRAEGNFFLSYSIPGFLIGISSSVSCASTDLHLCLTFFLSL